MRFFISAAILIYAAPASAGQGIFAPMREMLLNLARSAADELGFPICLLGIIAAFLSAMFGLGSPAKATMIAFIGFFTIYAEDILGAVWKQLH